MNNKVYINPKFNRIPSTNFPLATSNKMHVNPNFSQHNMMQNNSRIYVNPHFIKPNICCAPAQKEILYNHEESTKKEFLFVPSKVSENVPQNITSKSRYSLVRHTATKVLPTQPQMKATTIKINKYKSVAITDFKKKFETKLTQQTDKSIPARGQKLIHRDIKLSTPKPKQPLQHLCEQTSTKINIRSRFKLRNVPLDSSKSVSVSIPFKSKIKRNLKKNNIPCPLFKKYGKCLRSIHGTCDYIHDKKHVSICRKFMKGICHDNGCLLSHEITSNKMPTCYFYLKGMCVKENCPYVHVKLNEKTKVCSEFLKGYCEKGDKCLNRHVAVYQAKERNKGAKQIICSSKNSKTKQTNVNKYKITITKDCTKIAPLTSENGARLDKPCHTDSRYYKEQKTAADIEESSEVIKPTRCKLGTLPSFIKL